MARADPATLLPIDQWATLMGINPWHINGFFFDSPLYGTLQSPHVFMQYDYQADFLSREEVARTIERAEEMVSEELGFFPAPRYIVGEELQYPENFRNTVFGYGGTPRNDWKAQRVEWARIVAPGIRAFTLLGTPTVTLTDTNADGIYDTFTTTGLATTVTDPSQISVAFAAADRYGGQPIDDTWLIRPVQVTISGGSVVVKGHAALLGKPVLQTALTADPAGLDPTVASNFVTTVEIYWDRPDGTVVAGAGNTANQGQAEWDGDYTVPPGTVEYLPIVLQNVDAKTGIVAVDWLLNGGQCPPQPREPDRVVVNYLAGVPYLTGGKMQKAMAEIVGFLAAGLLAAGRAGESRSARIIDHWNHPPNYGESSRPLTAREIEGCPFGDTRGAQWAWKRTRNLRNLVAARL